MSYGIRPGLVEENKGILELIYQALRSGQPTRLACDPREGDQALTKLRRILRATELLYDEAGGRYLNLGPQVRLKLEITRVSAGPPFATIVVSPRDATSVGAWQPADEVSELDAQTASLALLSGASTIIRFTHAVPAGLEDRLVLLGWQEASRETFPDGSTWIHISRAKARASVMASLGFAARRSPDAPGSHTAAESRTPGSPDAPTPAQAHVIPPTSVVSGSIIEREGASLREAEGGSD